MKTVGYTMMLLGIIAITFGFRARTIVQFPGDLKDLSIAAFTADTKGVGEILSRRGEMVDVSKSFGEAETSISSRTGDASQAVSGATEVVSDLPGGAGKRTPADLVALGKYLKGKGFICSENKALGDNPRPGVHMATGYHYKYDNSGAIDVNWPNASEEPAKMDALAPVLRAKGFHVLWRVKGHYNHLHVDISRRDI